MKCPHCGEELTPSEAARALRAVPSEERTKASRENGAKNKPKPAITKVDGKVRGSCVGCCYNGKPDCPSSDCGSQIFVEG